MRTTSNEAEPTPHVDTAESLEQAGNDLVDWIDGEQKRLATALDVKAAGLAARFEAAPVSKGLKDAILSQLTKRLSVFL